MKFTQNIISLALISALTACGGSSSSSTKPPTIAPPPAPVLIQTVVKGKAIKGTIANAVVTVYKYVDGKAVKLEDAELAASSIITEDDGSYTITLLDYDGAIKVELSVGENTTMICDAPAGCGELAHGAPIALATVDPTLVLSAISTVGSDNAGTANVNISALTHLAAALIEADESGVSETTIQAHSSIIANAFNIMGSLTALEPTAVENAASVAGEDNVNELRYGLINAGIMSVLFAGQENATGVLSNRLADVIEDIVEHNGALLVHQDDNDEGFELSLVEVLDSAGDVAAAAAQAIAADPILSSQDNSEILGELDQQEITLENQSEYEEANEDEDGRSEPETEVPTTGDAIAKAKAMVADVRLFSHLFEVGKEANTGVTTEGDKYIELIDSAGLMVEAEAASFLLLADVTDALSEMGIRYEAGTITEGTFPIGPFLSIDGAVGSITLDEETANGGILFKISATSGSEKISLNASAVFAEDGLSIVLNLDGSIESAGAMLSLTQGSFAKVNLDSAISRTSLEDDTYAGEITSGELSLEVILEQKASDTVIDPVAFTGMIKTKLMPVKSHVLDAVEQYARDENYIIIRDENGNPVREVDRYLKSTETNILPEMLTLSGGFSSLEGNLIRATLTVNIKNLENYEAPEFKYIGAPVADMYTITVSDDKNTLNAISSELMSQPVDYTFVFTSHDTQGAWSSEETIWNPDQSTETPHRVNTTTRIPRTYGTMSGFDTATNLDEWAFFETVTPNDDNGDGVADSYTWKGYSGSIINDDYALVNNEGEVHDLVTPEWGSSSYDTFEELMEAHRMYPASIANAADAFIFEIKAFERNELETNLTTGARASVFFSDNDYSAIAEGGVTVIAANITSSLPIEDVFTITVSDDSNTVTVKDDTYTRVYGVDYTNTANFTFTRHVTSNIGDEVTDIRTFSTNDVDLDVEELLINRHASFGIDDEFYLLVRITPIDENNDGLADYFTQSYTYSDYINEEGVLVDEDGIALIENPFYAFDTWESAELHWQIPFNPFSTTNALEAYKQFIVNGRGSYLTTYIDGVGSVEAELSTEDIASIVIGSTTFSGVNTHPDSDESLENEDVFLDLSAALSLEATLGDYQVNLMLSGQRTAFDDGKFDLEMSYKLPGDENMRKFVAHMKTDEEGSFSVNNSEGVLLIMNDVEDSTSDVIGSIVVGSSATKVADIEDRDGVIWFVFTDETTETL
ncbi:MULTISPECIES: hypothetical protein [unclassified Colwellia]|uniref:hypothetical protein n=1 Tax=unclassified Colwellia TaxID=196834 RepID=UPI0015F465AE|nr:MULTISPECIES: hypothetical protein [unclassified Colwellia]MBA6378061.1 hypothetical protein [Colwellia sp. BRX10-7]MBA6388333.1 hypothetical protein [Colwellia sp. BRX10-2]MBA6400491.1 hypothetical protein [Colwellia sp. BRX10-5]MBA6407239.1 hypothetical protein [Colwellia sp. BRX10-1]